MRGMGAEREIRGELDGDEGEEVEEEVEEDLMNGHDDYQAPGKDEKRREGLESTENDSVLGDRFARPWLTVTFREEWSGQLGQLRR